MSAIQQLLTDHIDIWTAAETKKKLGRGRASGNATSVHGIKKLRELILELAVRGKLVPQDTSDEPASELLKRIQTEKAKLIVEGKIKKDKAMSPITDKDLPFVLPQSWNWVRFGEITNFGTTVKLDRIDNNAWVLDLEDIEKDTSKLLRKTRFSERGSLSDKNSFRKDDVLYGKLRPYLNKVIVADEDGVCTTEILPIRCYGPFNSNYFKTVLKSPYFLKYVNARSYGMKMPRLGTEDGRQASFPLAPLAEQHRIVAKVDELMALCDQLETEHIDAADAHEKLVSHMLGTLTESQCFDNFNITWQRITAHFDIFFTTEASIDALKQTLLQLAVMGKLVSQDKNDEPASELLKRIQAEKAKLIVDGKSKRDKPVVAIGDDEKPFELPQGWEWVRLGAALEITGGITLGRKLSSTDLVELPYLRVANVQRGHLALDSIKIVEIQQSELSRYQLLKNDLLVTEGGDWDKVGRTAIWNSEIEICLHQNHIFRMRCPTKGLSSSWIEMYMNSIAKTYFQNASKQTTNLASINMTQLKNCLLAVPAFEEQCRIVAKVDEIMVLCDQMKIRIDDANQLQRKLADVMVEQAVA